MGDLSRYRTTFYRVQIYGSRGKGEAALLSFTTGSRTINHPVGSALARPDRFHRATFITLLTAVLYVSPMEPL